MGVFYIYMCVCVCVCVCMCVVMYKTYMSVFGFLTLTEVTKVFSSI